MESMDSNMLGHEQLKSILIEDEGLELHAEEVLIIDTLSIIRQAGGDSKYQRIVLLCLGITGIFIFGIIFLMSHMQAQPNVLCSSGNDNYITIGRQDSFHRVFACFSFIITCALIQSVG